MASKDENVIRLDVAPDKLLAVMIDADFHVFRDGAGGAASVARDLADAYRLPGREPDNASVLFKWLQPDVPEALRTGLDPARIRAADEQIGAIAARLPRMQSRRDDAAQVRDEFAQAARLLRLGAERGAMLCEGRPDADARAAIAPGLRAAADEHRRLWLLRNRPGGLRDSVARMEALLPDRVDHRRATP